MKKICFYHLQRRHHHRNEVVIEMEWKEASMSVSVFSSFSPCDTPTVNTRSSLADERTARPFPKQCLPVTLLNSPLSDYA